ncbi:hypothetical protein P7C70_g4443, partial [Phenoliferia sp. Uapishka_3]
MPLSFASQKVRLPPPAPARRQNQLTSASGGKYRQLWAADSAHIKLVRADKVRHYGRRRDGRVGGLGTEGPARAGHEYQAAGSGCLGQSSYFAASATSGAGDIARWGLMNRDTHDCLSQMANHQTLSDWIYLWSFSYLSSHHSSVFITLKASLKWIPFIGWACQIFGFIFLSRAWVADKAPFKHGLENVADGLGEDGKLALLFFPEGTLVTGNTRPLSAKFALKSGIEDFKHTLLPRSTGLFFALRTLSPKLPSLSLVDLTVAYPGPVSPYWPEDYYDLSIWYKNVPPPSIHVHIRKWDVSTEVPLGTIDGSEGTEEEKKIFEEWLRARWGEKDALMDSFVQSGSFGVGAGAEKDIKREGSGAGVVWPIQLRNWWEIAGAFSYGIPLALVWLAGPIVMASAVGAVGKLFGGGVAGGAAKECGCGKMGGQIAGEL